VAAHLQRFCESVIEMRDGSLAPVEEAMTDA